MIQICVLLSSSNLTKTSYWETSLCLSALECCNIFNWHKMEVSNGAETGRLKIAYH